MSLGSDEASVRGWIARARREVEAARYLSDSGFGEQAVSRSYYAAFYAATAALEALRERRGSHAGVISAFNRRVVREGSLPRDVAMLLRVLFDKRNAMDYEAAPGSSADAEAAIGQADRFVDAVDEWLSSRPQKDRT